MKKIMFLAAILMAALFTFQPQTSFAKEKKELTEAQQATLDSIETRVNEIQHMDKSKLSKAEKKELKMELKKMKKEAKALGGGGIYLSVGAVLIIILVLILIL